MERSTPRRKRWRRLAFSGLAAAGLLALATLSIALALRSAAGRHRVLERASAALEDATGVRASAEDFALAWRRSAVELYRVELRTGDAGAPFFTADRLRAELRPGSLLTSHFRIRALEADAPVLDLGAPVPWADAEPSDDGDRLLISIERIAVRGGAVEPPPGALPEDSWLESWRFADIDLDGSFFPRELTARIERATVRAERRGAEPLDLALAGRLRGPPAGPYEVEALSLSGPGLTLDASGRLALAADQPFEVEYDFAADPGLLLPGVEAGGRLEAAGRLDLRRRSGEARLDARQVPAALVEPWLGGATLERLGAAGTVLDADADLDLDAGTLTGRATVDWRRRDERLLSADLDLARLTVAADGTPELAGLGGTLRVSGADLAAELLLEPWLGAGAPERMRLGGTRFDLDATYALDPDAPGGARGEARLDWRREGRTLLEVDATLTGGALGAGGALDLGSLGIDARLTGRDLPPEILAVWVDLTPLERLDLAGTAVDLDAEVDLRDVRGAPRVRGRADAAWRRGAEALVEVAARAPGTARGTLLAFEGQVLPAEDGRRGFAGELRAPGWSEIARARLESGRVELDLPDLSATLGALRRVWPRLATETTYDPLFDGSLQAAVDVDGELADPRLGGSATWQRGDGARLALDGEGVPTRPAGDARLRFEAFDLASLDAFAPGLGLGDFAGRVDGTLEIAGDAAAWSAALSLTGERLRWGTDLPELTGVAIEATSDGATLRLGRFEASADGLPLAASGELELARPIRRARLEIEATRPVAGIDRVLATATLDAGVIRIDATEIDVPAGRGELRATVPLPALESLPGLEEQVASWTGPDGPIAAGDAARDRTVTVRFDLPQLDAAALLSDLGVELPEPLSDLGIAARGEVEGDLGHPAGARGAAELPALSLDWDGHRVQATEPVRLELADGRLTAARSPIAIDGRRVELVGGLDLASGWRLADPFDALIARVDAEVEGVVDAALLNPYLGGAAASGPLHLDLRLGGPPERLDGRLTVAGPEARLLSLSPYFTRLEDPQIEIEIEGGETVLRRAWARLNQGAVELTGYREPNGEAELFAEVEDVRYRLDYGLSAVLSGSLQLALPAEGRGRLSGRLVVERGLLRRDLNLEREILSSLLAPAVAVVPDPDDPFAAVDLDLRIFTAEGVRIRNNLADLRATWSPLTVRGTLAGPLVDGRLDVEPGGFAYLYGQTARIDQGTITLSGYPELPPELDVDFTTSLEDPMVAREGAGRAPVAAPPREAAQIEADREALLAAGVASHYADQLAGRVGQALGGTRITVAPLLVFGETDPGARLTVSRDLSTQVAVAVSVDLRSEGRQTYLLDLHDFRPLPRMSAQLFTNDERNQGATIQQTFNFGGGRADETRPVVRAISVDVPAGFELKRLRAATGLEKGDRLPEGAEFDVEVDLADHLRQKGYPGAEVKVRVESAGAGVDVFATVDPGVQVSFEFRGTSIPRAARRAIRGLYRTDFFEPAAIEEMRREAVRALRGLGHREPEVTIEVVADEAGAGPRRTVVIDADGGERQPITGVEFPGVPPDVALRLVSSFAAQVDRIELALGLEDADRRLLGLLRGLGYPQPEIVSRRLDDERLIVELATGERRRIVEIAIEGVGAEDAERLRGLLLVTEGDPARSDALARSVVAIERDLRQRGHVDARARAVTASAASPDELTLGYRVEPGPRYEVADVRLDGARTTRPSWAERVARLDHGAAVDPEELGEARRRLFDTGLFRSVLPDVKRGEKGQAAVVFEVEERPRYQVAYGLRWESSLGGGAVVDVTDRNAFGRGVTLGLRGLWSAEDQSLRFYSSFPKVFGTQATLELFAEGREFEEPGDPGPLLTRRAEGTFQVSYPLARHTDTRGYYRYRDSRTVERIPSPADPFDRRNRNPVLGWQLVHDTRDDKIDATRGLLSSLDLTGAGQFLGSDFRFVRFFGKVSLFRRAGTWGGKSLVWAQGLRLGVAEAFGGSELNRDDRFFAGGEFSVRGYPNQSLGPRTLLGSTTVARGGESLLVVNQELRFPLVWDLRGVVFFDAGNVWEAPSDLASDFFTATGLGLRASTPVGLVRLDVAFPLDRREGDDSVKFYLGLGNVF